MDQKSQRKDWKTKMLDKLTRVWDVSIGDISRGPGILMRLQGDEEGIF